MNLECAGRAGNVILSEFALTVELVAAIYEAALDPIGLTSLAQLIAQVLRVETAGIWFNESGLITELSVTSDIAESHKPYLAYYHALDVWQSGEHGRGALSRLDTPVLGTEIISDAQLVRSEFYNDFARRFGITNPLGGAMSLTPTSIAFVSFNRDSSRFRLAEEDKAPLAALMPHIKAALQLRLRLRDSQRTSTTFFTLEALAFGAMICDRQGMRVYANAKAEALARRRRTIVFNGGGKPVTAILAVDSRRLQQMIHDAAATGKPGNMMLADYEGVPSLIVSATPLPTNAFGPYDPHHALVALREIDDAPSFNPATLIQLFRLSPAQAALASALYEGKSFDDIAEVRRVKVSTLRTHFKEVLNRTGAKNLRDLVRLLGTIPPIR
jgi:DNA-binding CsgD family transcriptional regulator